MNSPSDVGKILTLQRVFISATSIAAVLAVTILVISLVRFVKTVSANAVTEETTFVPIVSTDATTSTEVIMNTELLPDNELADQYWGELEELPLSEVKDITHNEIRGLYVGSGSSLDLAIERCKNSELNAIVIDLKNEWGCDSIVTLNFHLVPMKAIIDIQRKYFQDGDESDLQPMILKDVADRTGLDISTISRVSNQKYAQTRWGTFRLRHFFSDSYRTESGEEMSTRRIKAALQEIVDGEDKHKPLNDDALREELTQRGFPIARRTISKYREQLGIPIARLRKE